MSFFSRLSSYVKVWDVHHPGLKHVESNLERHKIG